MASKFRPKGSYKELLNIPSTDFRKLTEDQLRAIVTKLNDTANKRINRLKQSGREFESSAYRAREGAKFTAPHDLSGKDLKTAYLDVKSFLEGKTSSLTGTKEYVKQFENVYDEIKSRLSEDEQNFDKRFKRSKVLKKSVVKKSIRDFWKKYEQWKEIEKDKNPDAGKGSTNINDVETFDEELYQTGKVSIQDMEQKAKEDYLRHERELQEEDLNDYEDDGNAISTSAPDRRGARSPKPIEYKGKGIEKGPFGQKIKYPDIKIFGD